jgi:tRNA(Arg) A34 adenosine deaminase TadA
MCLGAIYWARIDRIYYGNTRVDAARIGFDDEFLYTEIVGRLNDARFRWRAYSKWRCRRHSGPGSA